MNPLVSVIDAFSRQRVLVVGDVMLDEYLWGAARRISPEAPVPVVELERRTYRPGGAANTAANVVGLGAQAALGGLVGADESAERLRVVLAERGIDAGGVVEEAGRPTTTKTRILAFNQQLLRVDAEARHAPGPEAERRLLDWAATRQPDAGVLVVSDYDKGVLSPGLTTGLIASARAMGRPVVVDPKGTDYDRYRGATVITPNVRELEQATGVEAVGEEALARAAALLAARLAGSALLVTRGARGMTLFTEAEAPLHFPACARHVYDVTGAGDTVVSVLALALAAGVPLTAAAQLANLAAGVVVGKVGTATLTRDELRSEMASQPGAAKEETAP